MKSLIFIFLLLSIVSYEVEARGKGLHGVGVKTTHQGRKNTAKKSSKKSAHKVTKKATSKSTDGQLGTSFAFDAASVRGKYQMAGQGIASVEDEKVLDDLLGLRRSFKDRDQQEQKRW